MNAPDARIERALAVEMLRSERTRALVLLVLLAVMALTTAIFGLIHGDVLVHVTGREAVRNVAPIAVTAVLGFEALMALLFHRLLIAERTPPRWVLPTATVVETSLPTVILAVLSGFLGSLDALAAPPLLFYFLLLVLAPLRLRVDLCLLTGVVAGAGYLAVALPGLEQIAAHDPTSIFSRPQPHVGKALVMVIAGVLAAFVTHTLRRRQHRTLALMAERQRVVDLFGQHVSQAVVDKLLEQDAELPSETRRVCMMFFDIRGFTTFSEARTSAEVVDFLNQLFEPLVDLVDQHKGIINKFLGDGFMAVFGAPMDDTTAELNATRAALAMLEEIERLRDAGEIPDIGVGIGLHAGPAMTGNVGSRGRKEYTIIGDTVNLASRIEALNKQMNTRLLVSEAVWHAVQEAIGHEVDAEAQAPVQVKGRLEPVVVYKLG